MTYSAKCRDSLFWRTSFILSCEITLASEMKTESRSRPYTSRFEIFRRGYLLHTDVNQAPFPAYSLCPQHRLLYNPCSLFNYSSPIAPFSQLILWDFSIKYDAC